MCKYFVVVMLMLLLCVGCANEAIIRVVTPETHYPTLVAEAEIFSTLYANRIVAVHPLRQAVVEVDDDAFRQRPLTRYTPRPVEQRGIDLATRQAIGHLADIPFADLFLCDSDRQRNALNERELVLREQRIGCLTPVVLMSASLRCEVDSLPVFWERGKRLGIMAPEYGGLGEVSARLLEHFPHEMWEGRVFEWDTQQELLTALRLECIDAVVVWDEDSTNDSAKGKATMPPLLDESLVVTLTMITLAEGHHPNEAQLFIRFLMAPAARQRIIQAGWGHP